MARKKQKRVLAQPDPPVLADVCDAEWSEETRKKRMTKPKKCKRSPTGIVAKQGPSKYAADDDVVGLDEEERRVARQNYYFILLLLFKIIIIETKLIVI